MEHFEAETRRGRTEAYALNGELVCPAGVGEGEERFTIPAKIQVGKLLGFQHWIETAPTGSQPWFRTLGDWQPTTVVLSNGKIAYPDEPWA